MTWKVEFHDLFEPEFDALSENVQDEILALGKLLEKFGPHLERPHVGTLKDSKHSNLKELRFNADDGVWQIAFVFDPRRKAVLLVAGDKSGKSDKAFYKRLIKKADKRFDDHLQELKMKSKRK